MQIDFAGYFDLERLLEIENETFDKNSFPLSRRNFIYHIKKKHVLVVKIDSEIAGYLLFFTYQKNWRIYSIAISNEYRQKGLGTSLIVYLKDYAVHKAQNLLLEVKTTNTQALQFYHSLGFKEIKILKDYYPDGDGFKMILPL